MWAIFVLFVPRSGRVWAKPNECLIGILWGTMTYAGDEEWESFEELIYMTVKGSESN